MTIDCFDKNLLTCLKLISFPGGAPDWAVISAANTIFWCLFNDRIIGNIWAKICVYFLFFVARWRAPCICCCFATNAFTELCWFPWKSSSSITFRSDRRSIAAVEDFDSSSNSKSAKSVSSANEDKTSRVSNRMYVKYLMTAKMVAGVTISLPLFSWLVFRQTSQCSDYFTRMKQPVCMFHKTCSNVFGRCFHNSLTLIPISLQSNPFSLFKYYTNNQNKWGNCHLHIQ